MKDKSKFHKWFYSLSHNVISYFFLNKYHFKTNKLDKYEGPAIIMVNHTTEVDMIMIVNVLKPHTYFVCGEHLLRSKIGPVLKFFYNPIPEFKGALATKTVGEILRKTHSGNNVMIFPEGSRSFNGETIKLPSSAGKLVKTSHSALITYHIEGGYFVAPRWAYNFRKGKMTGHIVHYYSKEEIASMSAQEITDHINQDIYENAYETQRKKMIPYKGKGLAEGIENYLIICPECNSYDSFASKGDEFWCTNCGTKGVYDKYGFLHGPKIRFDSVYDWGKWIEQKFDSDMQEIKSGAKSGVNQSIPSCGTQSDTSLFFEPKLSLYKITSDHKKIDLDKGDMKVFLDRMELCGHVFKFDEIVAMSMLYYGKTLLFTHEDINYGITGESFHAWKCNRLYDLQKGKI